MHTTRTRLIASKTLAPSANFPSPERVHTTNSVCNGIPRQVWRIPKTLEYLRIHALEMAYTGPPQESVECPERSDIEYTK